MSNIRSDLTVVSTAIPSKLKKYVDRIVEIESFETQSDYLRKILIDSLKNSIGAEDLAEIMAAIQKMKENRI